jgi:hypothetical protein
MSIQGVPQLRARLKAITPDKELMRTLALSAVREQKIEVPRRTGNLGRSIHIGSVTASQAETIASANYALFVHEGTRPHTIVPRTARALRWAPGGGSTLGGRPRAGANVRFAKRVQHPGTRANPFMVRGAQKALAGTGLKASVITSWNKAA